MHRKYDIDIFSKRVCIEVFYKNYIENHGFKITNYKHNTFSSI